jgi:acetate kinase
MEMILVINAGSSSVKFQVFGIEQPGLKQVIKGEFDGIGVRPRLRSRDDADIVLIDQNYAPADVPNVAAAIQVAGAWLRETRKLNIVAVGHRVVHGGPQYDKPVLLDSTVLANLERYISLAPLHQPNNLAPIRSLLQRFPQMPQVACFDTGFHRGHSRVADHYAIPQSFYADGVRRYGFHGLSYEYVSRRLQAVAPDIANGRVIIAHLGSGASMCAISNGHSVETTMGFTALDGLPMGTRPGQIDPGIVLYLLTEKAMSPEAVQDFLYKECGLKGLSGVGNDVRDLLESREPGAALALDHFVYRISLYAGMLAASLGGLDAFVFTAGIGERAVALRERIVDKLGWLGAELDHAANASGQQLISQPRSRVKVYVMPTNEELMIAEHTWALLSSGRTTNSVYKRPA